MAGFFAADDSDALTTDLVPGGSPATPSFTAIDLVTSSSEVGGVLGDFAVTLPEGSTL